MRTFRDRQDAGRQLARALQKYRGDDGIVFALPRGGVPLGVEVATTLEMPLDLIIPRKIGHPYNPEYAICALAESGKLVCNQWEADQVDQDWLKATIEQERQEAKRRRERYLQGRASLSAHGKLAILVDDGIATGLTILAAIADAKQAEAESIVVAIPVVPKETAHYLEQQVDELLALAVPEHYLGAVGAYYEVFNQVSDEEVIALLAKVRADR